MTAYYDLYKSQQMRDTELEGDYFEEYYPWKKWGEKNKTESSPYKDSLND